MSLYQRFPGGDFGPLFRLLDDYDTHRSGVSPTSTLRTFQPKFDVREVKDAYELQGELPGIDQKDISIEFADSQTLVVKGRTERETSTGDEGSSSHRATVEDVNETEGGADSSKGNKQVSTTNSGNKQVSKHADHPKYWVTERSVGEFHRSFTFPSRVDIDNVKASMKNGILSVAVPKARATQAKKINIEGGD
ncbi:MAG: hypothetical protein M1832_005996 [Thelocarpon impressellum]|nr:MAG: hypothetical protein M1832_005996 [Thelocarpon impressellum]